MDITWVSNKQYCLVVSGYSKETFDRYIAPEVLALIFQYVEKKSIPQEELERLKNIIIKRKEQVFCIENRFQESLFQLDEDYALASYHRKKKSIFDIMKQNYTRIKEKYSELEEKDLSMRMERLIFLLGGFDIEEFSLIEDVVLDLHPLMIEPFLRYQSKALFTSRDEAGCTFLFKILEKPELVEKFIQKCPQECFLQRDAEGNSVLHMSAWISYQKSATKNVALLLASRGKESLLGMCNKKGNNCLHEATERALRFNNPACLRPFFTQKYLSEGAIIGLLYQKNAQGETPIQKLKEGRASIPYFYEDYVARYEGKALPTSRHDLKERGPKEEFLPVAVQTKIREDAGQVVTSSMVKIGWLVALGYIGMHKLR